MATVTISALRVDARRASKAREVSQITLRRFRLQPKQPSRPAVLVIGAGPGGLATAASLKQAGVKFDLIDRAGCPAGAYARLNDEITLSSPAAFTELPGLPIQASSQYITIAEYRRYLERYARHFELRPEQQTVESIERRDGQFIVKLAGESTARRYQIVVAATGMCDHPTIPTIAGLNDGSVAQASRPEVIHARDWPGPADLSGKRVLIVGGASSAIAIAEQCAEAGLPVVVSTRRDQMRFSFTRILGIDVRRWVYPVTRMLPRWLFGKRCSLHPAFVGTERNFSQHQKSGLITVRGPIERFNGEQAKFGDSKTDQREAFDLVVLATGYRFSMPFLPSDVARAPAGHPLADRGESCSWPGLYFVGMPCSQSVGSEFLHGIAADAPVVAERIRVACQSRSTK